jgi:putative colanic acid biosynthesis UDP-glucose lipid carrier transferase
MPRDVALLHPSDYADGVDSGASRPARSVLKRALDLSGSALGLLILLPLLVIIATAIWIESGGPVLFRQSRSGMNGRPFTIYKFRTMQAAWSTAPATHAVRNDCRTTQVGRFLRRSSFDELPQLINVLKGEMSLVGPRPHALEHDQYYAAKVADYSQRFATRPGLTGLAQVSGCRGEVADADHMARRVRYDLDYIRNWSLAGDISILARTLVVAPFDPAAY